MKKMNYVFLTLLIMLTGTASLSAALTFSPPAPKTGETVTFSLNPSGPPGDAISWNFGDGTPVQTSSNRTMTHIYAAVGTYSASAGYSLPTHYQVDRAMVTVIDQRQVLFSPLQPKAGQAVTFTAQNFFSSCIRWDFGDGTVKNGAAAESHTYASAGNYTVHAYEECGNTYGAAVAIAVAAKDEEPPPITPTKPTLAVAFLNLYFAGGKAEASVAKDFAGLQAFADIQVEGIGILQWQWLVDNMVVKSDTMAVSFGNKFSLDSGKIPGLPTAIPGRHVVTLRFQQPATSFTIPAIGYFVGLRGPAPVIRRVTPATLAPGKEYTLELEGAELTQGTEISFPAPLALVKKPVIMSSSRAQATVFVPPTAGNGSKAVSAWNEYGKSNGPGQVTIAVPVQTPKLPDAKPFPGPKPPLITTVSIDWFKEQLKKSPVITGGIDCYPYSYGSSASYGQVNIFVKKGGAPVSGAVVKVDGNVIPESNNTPGHYFAEPQLALQSGHIFTTTVKIDGVTYSGSGGKIDTIVHLTKPAHGSTIYFKKFPQFDCKWTFSNGPAQVHLYALYIGQPGNKGIFEQDLTADHVSIPTDPIPGAQGELYFFLGRQYADIKFDGLLAFTSGLHVYQNFGQPQSKAGLSDVVLEKTPLAVKALEAKPSPGPKPPVIDDVSINWFKEQLKKSPVITGGIDFCRYGYDSAAASAQINIFINKGGTPVSGAVVKVDGIVIPECNAPYQYFAEPQMELEPGHVFTITVQIDGKTYTASGGKIDTIVKLTQPQNHSTIYFKKSPLFDCKWTFSNGPAQVHLYVLYIGQPANKGIFEQDLTEDHISIPTAPIPGAQGYLYFFLGRQYADIKFDGLLAFTSGVHVYQNYGHPQSDAGLSDIVLEKAPLKK